MRIVNMSISVERYAGLMRGGSNGWLVLSFIVPPELRLEELGDIGERIRTRSGSDYSSCDGDEVSGWRYTTDETVL